MYINFIVRIVLHMVCVCEYVDRPNVVNYNYQVDYKARII